MTVWTNETCMTCGRAIVDTWAASRARHVHLEDGGSASVCYGCYLERNGLSEYGTCAVCGDLFPLDQLRGTAHGMMCEQCHDSQTWTECPRCGAPVAEGMGELVDGSWYCSARHATEDGWTRCERCGDWTSNSRYIDSRDENWCLDCYEWSARECDRCGDTCAESDGYWSECGDYWFCDQCHEILEQESHRLHPYNYKPFITFYGDGSAAPFLGVELETDRHRVEVDQKAYLEALVNLPHADRFYCMEDGSLTDDGVEVASMPCTLQEHVDSLMWEEVIATALRHHYTSHDNNRCGLHVHISRAYFGKLEKTRCAGYYKLFRLVQRFEKQLTSFSRRTSDRWCAYSHSAYHKSDAGVCDKGRAVQYAEEDDKYRAVNFRHDSTLEMRIFRGTLRRETLYATLALVDGLARCAKQRGEAFVESCTWYDLMSWTLETCTVYQARAALLQYLRERGLYDLETDQVGTEF